MGSAAADTHPWKSQIESAIMVDEYPRRKSLRLPGYNYSHPADIFVTFCTHNRQQLFGSIVNSKVVLSEFGEILARRWSQMPSSIPGVMIDEYIVMPDHFHGILWTGADDSDSASTCSDAIHWVKLMTQRDISKTVRSGATRYHEKLWQRGFYDRIIRNERELEEVRFYINSNPMRWNEI